MFGGEVLRRLIILPKIILKCLSRSLGLIRGELLGEQLIALDRSARTMGLENWAKREYR